MASALPLLFGEPEPLGLFQDFTLNTKKKSWSQNYETRVYVGLIYSIYM